VSYRRITKLKRFFFCKKRTKKTFARYAGALKLMTAMLCQGMAVTGSNAPV